MANQKRGPQRRGPYRPAENALEVAQEVGAELLRGMRAGNGVSLEESIRLASRKGLDPRTDPDVAAAWGTGPQNESEGPDTSKLKEEEAEENLDFQSAEMIDDPVRMYLREIGRVSLLTAKDERALARRMEAGKHVGIVRQALGGPEERPATSGRWAWSCSGAPWRPDPSSRPWPSTSASPLRPRWARCWPSPPSAPPSTRR